MGVRLLRRFVEGAKSGMLEGLSSGSRFVLWIYCDCADNDSLEAFPGTPMIMQMTGLAERQVQRYVQELRARRMIEIVDNRGGKRRFATYRVRIGLESTAATLIPTESRERLEAMGLASPSVSAESAPESDPAPVSPP